MKKTLLILAFLAVSLSVKNWTGLTPQQRKKQAIERHIRYLYDKYPPDQTDWMYEITKSIK
jgi:P2-related tail formation protein